MNEALRVMCCSMRSHSRAHLAGIISIACAAVVAAGCGPGYEPPQKRAEASPSIVGLLDPDDSDFDGVFNDLDNCPDDYNPEQQDTDGDGAGDVCAAG